MKRAMNGVWVAIALVGLATAVPTAQWLKEPTKGIPRTADGKPNLSAPAPRLADGKPDLSGLWQPAADDLVALAEVNADRAAGMTHRSFTRDIRLP